MFHVMSTLCYFFAKKIYIYILYNTLAQNTGKFSLLLRCADVEDGLLKPKGMSL